MDREIRRTNEVVAVARVLACNTRLAMLGEIVSQGTSGPKRLAERVGVSVPAASMHARRLVNAGVLVDFDGGLCNRLRMAKPDDSLGGSVSRWLQVILKNPQGRLKKAELAAEQDTALHTLIFEIATGYANARRVTILAQLESGPVRLIDLSMNARFPLPSVMWHVRKLLKRQMVRAESDKRGAVLHPAQGRTKLHCEFRALMLPHFPSTG